MNSAWQVWLSARFSVAYEWTEILTLKKKVGRVFVAFSEYPNFTNVLLNIWKLMSYVLNLSYAQFSSHNEENQKYFFASYVQL